MNRILLLADIHIGSIKDTTYVYNVITDIIENEVILTKTDAIVFLGDFFDKLFTANSEYISTAINIMSYIVRACKRNNTKIRMITGTYSHDMNQYNLFNYHLNEDDIDMKIINTVTVEELLPNVNVLYIPEEFVESKDKYYKKYLYSNNKYDYIFGHGVIIEGMPMVKFDSEGKSNEKKIPHFKSKELSSISKLSVYGHQHTFVNMDRVYYLGSLFRNSFGEEDPKGYGVLEDDKFTFVENKDAYIYKTYEYNDDSEIYLSADNILREINKLKDDNVDIFSGDKIGKIRVIFKLPKDIDPSFKENIRSLLFNDKHISTMMKENSDIISDMNDDVNDEFDFILSSLPTLEKIHQYINKMYDITMTLDELTEYINEDLKL